MKPHRLSVLQRCPAEGRRDDHRFREQFSFRVTNGRSDETLRWRTPVGRDTKRYAYGCPRPEGNGWTVAYCSAVSSKWRDRQQGTGRLITPRRLLFRQTPDGHETRRVWRAVGPKILQNRWQPEEKEMSACTKRPSCPEGKWPRARGKLPSKRACCFSWSWSWWFWRYQSSDKLSLGGGNIWKPTAAQRSFRDWCSGGQETRSAWLPITLKSCSGQQQELDVETVTWKVHPRVIVRRTMDHRPHGHSCSWREQTYIGKPQLSSSFSVSSTCILSSFSSQERYCVLHKIETNFEDDGMLQRVDLHIFGFTYLLLSFCFDGINKKRKNAPLSAAALLSFSLACEISLCTSFQTFLRRDCHCSLSDQLFFCHQVICIHCQLHPQPNIFIRKKSGHIWCAYTSDLLWAKVSNSASSNVLAVVTTAATDVGEWLWMCRVFFFAQMEVPSFFKVLVMKQCLF